MGLMKRVTGAGLAHAALAPAALAPGSRATGRLPDRAPIDRVHLARYTLGNLALDIEILGLFAMQAPETLAQIANAQTEKAWRDAVHTLKGSARAVGAVRLGDVAERAEALKTGASEIARGAAIEALRGALDDALQYIARLPAA